MAEGSLKFEIDTSPVKKLLAPWIAIAENPAITVTDRLKFANRALKMLQDRTAFEFVSGNLSKSGSIPVRVIPSKKLQALIKKTEAA